MNNNKPFRRLMAMALSVVMILMLIPVSASTATETPPIGMSGEIIAFKELASEIAAQRVPISTEESALNLPETLTVSLQSDTMPDAPEYDSGEPDDSGPVTVELTVTWRSAPEYDGDTAGDYIFTPLLPEGYTLAEGVEPPQIPVTVEETSQISAMPEGLMFSALAVETADYSWYDGNTAALKFTINSAAKLKGLADIVNGEHGTAFGFSGREVSLTADLDLSGYENWTPIGTNYKTFDGTFKGNGYTISGLTINDQTQTHVGLFGLVPGSVSDLYLTNVNITGRENVGGIAGEIWGSIINCAVTGGTVSGNLYTGGIAGKVSGSLTKCFTTCNVRGISISPYSVGGVAGRAEFGGTLSDCYATGSVIPGEGSFGNFEGYGGVVGTVNGGTVQNCFATGEVTGTTSVGGVAGSLTTGFGATTLKNCAALNIRVAGGSDAGSYGGPNTGRVVGRITDPLVINPIAFSGVIVVNAGGSKVDGTDKSSAEIKAEGFFETNGFSAPSWQNQTEMLPILAGFPGGLQSGELPAHIGSPIPTEPLALAATPGNASVVFSWSAPGSSGASNITRYEVRKDTGSWVPVGMATTYTFTGLTNGTIYTLEVRAVNSYGNGAAASIQRAPASPGSMAAIPGDKSVILNWVTPSAQVGYYQVRYNGGSWTQADSDYMHTFIGLANGEQYTFELRGLEGIAPFGVLFTASINATPVSTPLEPTNLAAVPGDGQVTLNWEAPYSDEGSPILGYEVSNNDGASWTSVGTDMAYTFTGLTNGTAYSLQVRAVNAIGAGKVKSAFATPCQPPEITSLNSQSFTYGDGGTYAVMADGTPPLTYSLSGQPAGVSINSLTGSVTVEKTVPVGNYPFTVTAANGSPTEAVQNFTLTISSRTPQKSDLQYSLPTARVYTGANLGVDPVTDKNGIGLTITVKYTGVNGTSYPTSGTPPKNAGMYLAQASIAGSSNINATTLSLGVFDILPKSITVTPTAGQSKTYGQSDPPLQYTLSSALVSGDASGGALARTAGENVGNYNIVLGTLTAGNNYTLSLSGTVKFTINPKVDAVFTIAEILPQTYTGGTVTPEPAVKDGTTVLTKGVDFTYGYSNNTNTGASASVSITGIGNYAGSTGSKTFTISPKANAAFTIAEIFPQTYTGGAITPEPVVKDGTMVLTKGVDFTYGYSNNINTGASATVSITGIGNYAGSTGSKTFTISPKADAAFTIAEIFPQTYTGGAITPEPEVNDGTTVLIKGVDFTYSYSNNTNAGASATVSIIGIGNYAGSTGSKTFTISPKADAAFTIAEIPPQTYTGGAITPEPEVNDGTTVLIKGVDFTYSYSNNTNTGTSAAVSITGIGNYAGSTGSATFTISPKADAAFTIAEILPRTYNGGAITPEPEVKDGAIVLTKSVDFTYGYSNNTNAGNSATVSITGIGNYAGSTGSKTFTISPNADAAFTIAEILPQTYTGGAITPEPEVKDETTVLIKGVDFTYSYSNNTNAGASAAVNITGIGNYAGSTGSKTFTISPKADAAFTIAEILPQTYTGGAVTPKPEVKNEDTVLTEGVDYTYGYSNNTDAGYSAVVNITGIGNYAGSTGSATFTICGAAPNIITPPTVSGTVYIGTALSQIELAGGEANVNGRFEWVNPLAAAVLGQNTFEARFVPDDTVIYTQLEGISITFAAINHTSSNSSTTYEAALKSENGIETTLLVMFNKDSGTASIDLGSQITLQGRTLITVPSIPGAGTYSLGIPVSNLSTTGEQGTVTLNYDVGSITIPSNMLTGVSGISGSKAEIAIGQGDKSALPDEVKSAIGEKPLIQLTLSIDGKQTDWSNPDAPVTVSIPYTPTAAELANPESIVVWYIDGSGNAVAIPNGHYDPATGMVTFDTTHFSDYAVAYNKVSFKDVAAGAWYNKAVSFIAAREITTGTGNGNYSPGAKLTRGEFIVLMMKAYGIAPDTNPADNFTDAGNTYYTGYLAVAKRLGITAGIGNNMYAPRKEITRQEMFTLLYNALMVIDQLPGTHGRAVSEADDQPQGNLSKTVLDFSDASQIAEWAREAMTSFVAAGTVGGSAGKLTPNRKTTRAEMAQVLYNLLGK